MARSRIRDWAHRLRTDAHAVYLAARDPRVPLLAKIVGLMVAAYALSPIDLIPDFVPVLGLLDDLVLVPAGVWLVLRLVPAPIMAEHRAAAERASGLPVSRTGAVLVIAIWTAAATSVALSVWSYRYW